MKLTVPTLAARYRTLCEEVAELRDEVARLEADNLDLIGRIEQAEAILAVEEARDEVRRKVPPAR